MYGYIRICKPELKIKDYETYRAFYCSLCDTLAKRYGPTTRFLLSYDLTFFTVFSLAAGNRTCSFVKGRCRWNPAKKCPKVKEADETLRLSADLTILLAWFKLADNFQDGGILKKLLCVLLTPYLYFRFLKAKKLQPELYRSTKLYFDRQYRAEHDPLTGVDSAAEPSASYFSALAALFAPEDRKENYSAFGYFLGRYIYLADAADDLAKDIRNKSFNPYIKAYEIDRNNLIDKLGAVLSSLELTAASADEAYRKCQNTLYRPITDNVISLGLFEGIDEIKKKYEEAMK